MSAMRVSDLPVDELRLLIRQEMTDLVREVVREALSETHGDKHPTLDDFPVDDLGPWPDGLTLSREEMYGDDER